MKPPQNMVFHGFGRLSAPMRQDAHHLGAFERVAFPEWCVRLAHVSKLAASSPATISALRSSNQGGKTSVFPVWPTGSSLAQPSGTVQAISNSAPPGERT